MPVVNAEAAPKGLAASYRKRLTDMTAGRDRLTESLGGTDQSQTELSEDLIKDKTAASREAIYSIIDKYYDGDKKLKEIADQIAARVPEALRAVANDDSDYLSRNPDSGSLLEVIAKTDGSRPSFLIRDGKIDEESSPAGQWGDLMLPNLSLTEQAIASVGRINRTGFHIGTGFLIAGDLICTNRHVLQAVASKDVDGKWVMKPGVVIDFGYEFRARKSVFPRELTEVVFCTADEVDPGRVDHQKLDIAIMRLKHADQQDFPLSAFRIGSAPEWAESESQVYIIGYPGSPGIQGLQVYGTALDILFNSSFGYKRIAPGIVIPAPEHAGTWTVAHDATTLAGNSGSIILVVGKENIAAGIHYGGSLTEPRENWGHIFGNTLASINSLGGMSLAECLFANNVAVLDMFQRQNTV